MKTTFKPASIFFSVSVTAAALASAGVDAAPSNSFAGSTSAPSNQYNQLVEQQRQIRSQPVYQQAAPQRPAQTTYQHADRSMGALGFSPNVPIPAAGAQQPARTLGQIGSSLIESNPKMGPAVTGAVAAGQIGMGTLNGVKAAAGAATAYAQPQLAPAVLPKAALNAAMSVNNFRQACNAGAWNDYAKRVREQQACLPYPGMK
jgi:hypothetical protein